MKMHSRCKGAITVEAAVFLPFFIIALMSFAFIVKIYYVNEIIHNALTGASRQMSVYSLLYYKTNAEEIISGIKRFSASDNLNDTLGDNWLASSIQGAGKDTADYARTHLALIPAAKALFARQLEAGFGREVNNGLLALNVDEGINGFDFSGSNMLADGRSVDISVRYRLKFPFLSGLLPGLKMVQAASACIWAGEEGIADGSMKNDKNQSVWDMTNLKRGQQIRKLQGANLPYNFPTAAKYENGTVASIKSLNIDEPYYRDAANLERKIKGYINKLEEFNGGGCGEVSISGWQILKKELVLIIPETELTSAQKTAIDRCIGLAARKGIILKPIKAYGKQGGSPSVHTVEIQEGRK